MKDYLKEYLDALRVERNLSSMTCEAYKRDLNDYLKFIKSKKINEIFEITQMHIREYIRELNKKGFASSSIARRFSSIRSYHKFLIAEKSNRSKPYANLIYSQIIKKIA